MAVKEPIAVVGSACRLPGNIKNPSELWALLQQPQDVQSEVPKDRFNVDAFYHADGPRKGRSNARHGYFLQESLRHFDASFFKIQAGEAESIDPQQRLLLETTYDALSAAGFSLEELRGSNTAVYVGIMTHDFEVTRTIDMEHNPTYLATGAATSIASNRLSYFFDWHGPSMTIDTACSSSLVAVHQAVQQLRSGGSKIAVAAGANIILSPMNYITESQLKMLSPTGRSRMWDEKADGYARGEGVCSVVLKTLSQALADGDTIECVIRETGVNQDGRTTGITMPSNLAQAALIRETYARAGLDVNKVDDRCQFFEAHGTGTPAGDPQEAEAISSAFFGKERTSSDSPDADDVLFVGSIKTVVGHTEGTAGIAGLMKASLAVQNGVVPPNLLFDKLSLKVSPFYQHLRIVQEAIPWPKIPSGQPRRVSVNSFGFGGTNAHAIVEQYQGSAPAKTQESSDIVNTLPLVFSANNERSLKTTMENTLRFIQENPKASLLDLTWTLLQKRSTLACRQSIVGHSREVICEALESAIEKGSKPNSSVIKSDTGNIRLLGIFTGQGAQWAGMLRALVLSIPYVKTIIAELDQTLQSLPAEYRPLWSLHDQLLLEGEASNVQNAEYSQPLCCAVQIVYVRLLGAAGIRFATIVGHSSGEIAAAFACGFLSADQAIKVAYLRGLTSKHASSSSSSGARGAMMAAKVSYQEAKELLELEAFQGRICVAACNSADSTTLSGDADAIEELVDVFEDEGTLAKVLKVDKAYHSHHMLPCSEPYIKALKDCGCATGDGDNARDGSSVAWYSSVYENKRMEAKDVTAEYWSSNLISPVLFTQALENATLEQGPLDAAIEVGAHPALKQPALATIKTICSEEIPYIGCMQRGGNDLDAFASTLGYLWEHFGRGLVEPTNFISAAFPSAQAPQNLSKILPLYPWDHSRSYWVETRAIASELHGPAPHLLLGKPAFSNSASTLQWHNVIRPKEHEWLQGHALQGQAVFPAAGYVMAAMEAALCVAGGRPVELLEVLDMSIDKAITFVDEDSSAELIVNVQVVSNDAEHIALNFTVDSVVGKEFKPSTSARGQLAITIGDSSSGHVLPRAQDGFPHLTSVNVKRFYEELDDLGYAYSKDFRTLETISRADARASGTMPYAALLNLVLHPATLDLAFQTLMGAYSAPGDKRLRSIYVPTHVDRIALVPAVCASALVSGAGEQQSRLVSFQTVNTYDKGDYLAGDIEVFDESNDRKVLFQVENLFLKPLSPPSAAEDHKLFTKTVWGPLVPEKVLDNPELYPTKRDREAIPVIERICYYFMRDFLKQVTDEDRANATKPHQRYIYWNEHVSARVREGTWHEWYRTEWESDTRDFIDELCKAHWYHPHVRIAKRVSENALQTIRENINPFLWFDGDGLLTEFYTSPLTDGPGWHYGQNLIGQISHRYQAMNILEIGAGTGSGTKYVLGVPQLNVNSYTFTDISPAFFERAQKHFTEWEDRMIFQKLDITRPPVDQGFKPHSYDMVVASSVLHATPKLKETMTNVRSLLKPGGHVVMLEAAHKDHTRVGWLFGLFPDWWAGIDEGRDLDPFATVPEWNAIFKQTGFSGVESQSTPRDSNLFMNMLFSTRAVNSKIARLYDPLSAPANNSAPPLVVIGGGSNRSLCILEEMRKALPQRRICVLKQFKDLLETTTNASKSSFVVLSELDKETFSNLDESTFESIKTMFTHASHVLWLTENAWLDHPYQAMSIAFVRSVKLEYPSILMQSLDVDEVKEQTASVVVEQLLRLEEGSNVTDDILWTLEPEVYVSKGRTYIPRIKHDHERNSRLCSERRPVIAPLDPKTTPVALKVRDKVAFLEPATLTTLGDKPAGPELTIDSQYSSAKAMRVADLGYLYIVQGTVAGTGETVIALSDTNASSICVPSNQIVIVTLPTDPSSVVLQIGARLLAQRVLNRTEQGSSILVYEPPVLFAKALALEAARQNIHVYVVTATSGSEVVQSSSVSYIQLHPRETDARLRRALPANISAFYTLSSKHNDILARRLLGLLTPGFSQAGLESLVQDVAVPSHGFKEREAVQFAEIQQTILEAVKHSEGPAVDIRDVTELTESEGATALSPWSTIKWSRDIAVPARIRPIDSGKLFSANKTYLLLGLAGSMGRSLARWMVTRGAQHVVISSRNPETPDPKWLEDVGCLGGNVTALSIDVSSEASIDAGLAYIQKHLPPIGGIAYGPLVLHDALFRTMDLKMWDVPVKSKVTGAKLLHERFSDPKSPLDFFVMFSSVAALGGNPGQANYTAANAFLQALANQRHAKGLPSSTIHIGAVIGVGYLARTQREQEFTAASDTVSEDEFLKLFAEAMVSGRKPIKEATVGVTDTADIEVITGVLELSAQTKETVKFAHDPRFGNLKIPEGRAEAGTAGDATGSMKERLLKATSKDEVKRIITEGLSEKMRGTLHIPAEEEVSVTAPLIDQGVDSLGAITVGTWFSKQLFVDIPLLRVLGGASIAELAAEAAERLSSSTIPLVAGGSSPTSNALVVGGEKSLSSSSILDTPARPDSEQPISGIDSPASDLPEGVEDIEASMKLPVRLSLTQEYSWKLQQQLRDDPTIFHNTIGVFMEGPVDLERLAKAFTTAMARHEIFRTAFREQGPDGSPVQVILEAPVSALRSARVSSRAEAEVEFAKVVADKYCLAEGETLKLADFYWGRDQHLFVFGYHRLAGDGSTTENFLAEVDQLYNGAVLPLPPQYAAFASRQRKEIEAGHLNADISYWTDMYTRKPASVLPILPLPGAQQQRGSVGWSEHTAVVRLSSVLAFRVRERAKKVTGVTPMHFYLAAFHVLLARLTRAQDVAVGLADTNRSSIQDTATMGYFANLLPVRFDGGSATAFVDELAATRDAVRGALKHSRVPHGVVLERLGLAPSNARGLKNAPLFQAVFDYRQGAAETGQLGGASFTEIKAVRERTPFDVTLEMSDDPAKDPLVTVKLQRSLYGEGDAKVLADAYVSVLTKLSSNVALKIGELEVW